MRHKVFIGLLLRVAMLPMSALIPSSARPIAEYVFTVCRKIKIIFNSGQNESWGNKNTSPVICANNNRLRAHTASHHLPGETSMTFSAVWRARRPFRRCFASNPKWMRWATWKQMCGRHLISVSISVARAAHRGWEFRKPWKRKKPSLVCPLGRVECGKHTTVAAACPNSSLTCSLANNIGQPPMILGM